jgi:protein TonB
MQETSFAAIPAPVRDTSGRPNTATTVTARPVRVEVLAVTADDGLLEQIGQSLDGDSTVRQADDAGAARGLLRPSQPTVVLLDVRGHDDLAQVVQELQSPDGTSIVVLFAPAEVTADVARIVRGSAAFAVLPIPPAPAEAAAVMAGAREECLARYALLTSAASSAPHVAPAAATPPAELPPALELATQQSARVASATSSLTPPAVAAYDLRASIAVARGTAAIRYKAPRVTVAVIGGIALVATAIVWLSPRKSAVVSQPRPSPQFATPNTAPGQASAVEVPAEALQQAPIDELLDSARAAMHERRYTDPEGNNALRYYRSVLAQDPGNREAREGLMRIAAVLQERVRAALAQHRLDEATRSFAQLRMLRPDDPGLRPLEVSLTAARQAELEQQQSGARAEQLARLVTLRIRQGQLLQPAGDSAKAYLAQLQRLPGDPQGLAGNATVQLQQAYVDKLRDAISRSQRAEADRWQAEARALGVSAAEIAAVQRDATARTIATVSRQQESVRLAQLVQARIDSGQLIEPTGDSALFHLNALRTLEPGGAAVATGERALSKKLLEDGRGALAARRLDAARADVTAARALGVNPDGVTALERDIAAASAVDSVDKPQPAPRLTRTRYVAPEYPSTALSKRLSGEVHVRVTVNADGKVVQAAVITANPPQVFDDAALSAVRRWRFAPLGPKGSAVETSATIDIVFQPEDAKK